MSEPLAIQFAATVYKVQTLVDKGLRVTLDLPEGSIEATALLMGCQQHGIVLDVTATEAPTAQPKRKRTAKPTLEWGDDGDEASDDTG